MNGNGMNILYVEDNNLDADLTRRELQHLAPEHKLDHVETLQAAKARLVERTDYDLVLTDMNLMDGNGLSLLSYIRMQALPLPVVVITGLGDEETAVAALKAGADDYIIKNSDYLKRLPITLQDAYSRFNQLAGLKSKPLVVLYAEHNSADIDLTRRHFAAHAAHILIDVVHTAPDALQILLSGKVYDVIMLDFNLPGMDALEALKKLRYTFKMDVPVVLVTGQGDDEVAVQAMKLGAVDYVIKSAGYLHKLPAVIENAHHRIELLREQNALHRSEARLRAIFDQAALGISQVDIEGHFMQVNQRMSTVLGYPEGELLMTSVVQYLHPDDREALLMKTTRVAAGELPSISQEVRALHQDGSTVWLNLTVSLIQEEIPGKGYYVVIAEEITERKRAEERLQRQYNRMAALRTIDMTITASLDLRLILGVVLDQIIAQTSIDAVSILLLDPHLKTLELYAARGLNLQVEKHRLTWGRGLAGRVLAVNRPVTLFDLQPHEIAGLPGEYKDLIWAEGIAAYCGFPLIAKGQVRGVLELYNRNPLSPEQQWLEFVETLAGQMAIAIDSANLFEALQRSNLELTLAYDATIEGWSHALDLRDKETEGHTQRVTEITLRLARLMGFNETELVHIRRGALLHDIGKLGVPDGILLKAGQLSSEEWEIMRQHPKFAYDMISPIAYLRGAIAIPHCHHEKWDGSGYPRGLKGDAIPLAARIFALVDVWDALTSDRHYRPAWTEEAARGYIQENVGVHFDPAVYEAFRSLMGW